MDIQNYDNKYNILNSINMVNDNHMAIIRCAKPQDMQHIYRR